MSETLPQASQGNLCCHGVTVCCHRNCYAIGRAGTQWGGEVSLGGVDYAAGERKEGREESEEELEEVISAKQIHGVRKETKWNSVD